MASPQAENGHLDLANELAEAFQKLQLSGYQWRILWVILRQTYGWHKKTDRISLSIFEEKTGIPQKHLIPALKELVERKIIIKDKETYIIRYGLQKDYELWKPLLKSGLPKSGFPEIRSPGNGREDLPKSGVKPLPKSGDTKENKETPKKKRQGDSSDPAFEQFYRAYPKHKAREKAEKAWIKLNPSIEFIPIILTALEKHKQSEDWKKENGKYIPYPATWLNDRRWEDEISKAATIPTGLIPENNKTKELFRHMEAAQAGATGVDPRQFRPDSLGG
jgi:phage replication O-like protein O